MDLELSIKIKLLSDGKKKKRWNPDTRTLFPFYSYLRIELPLRLGFISETQTRILQQLSCQPGCSKREERNKTKITTYFVPSSRKSEKETTCATAFQIFKHFFLQSITQTCNFLKKSTQSKIQMRESKVANQQWVGLLLSRRYFKFLHVRASHFRNQPKDAQSYF